MADLVTTEPRVAQAPAASTELVPVAAPVEAPFAPQAEVPVYDLAYATAGNTIIGAKVPDHVVAIRSEQSEALSSLLVLVSNVEDSGKRIAAGALLHGIAALHAADDAIVLKLHNASKSFK